MKKSTVRMEVIMIWISALTLCSAALFADDVTLDIFADLPELQENGEQVNDHTPVADTPGRQSEFVSLEAPVPLEERDGLVSVAFHKDPINDVIELFMQMPGVNIVSTVDSTKLVTGSMHDQPWEEALQVILDAADLALFEKTPGIYMIITKEELAAEPVDMATYRLQFLTTSEVIPLVSSMLIHENAKVSAAPNNILLITETGDRLQRITKKLDEIDRPKPQVFIEAKFVELNEQAIKDLGINWRVLEGYRVGAGSLEWGYGESRTRDRSRTDSRSQHDRRTHLDEINRFYDMHNVQYEDSRTTFQESPPGSGNFIAHRDIVPTRLVEDRIERGREVSTDIRDSYSRQTGETRSALLTADQLEVTLSALKQQDGISIISNPKIIVSSGETASIHVGRQDPEIRAVADINLEGRLTYQRAAWIESGVRLEVSPVVNTEDHISLHIKPTLSRVIDFAESGDVRVRIPVLSTRTIESRFNLASGMTAAIGGLTETRDQERETKVPLLGDLPIIGRLFRHTHTERLQDEIVIFVSIELADTENIRGNQGIPGDGILIHRHLQQQELRERHRNLLLEEVESN